jgi:hypothetical protein
VLMVFELQGEKHISIQICICPDSTERFKQITTALRHLDSLS